jgi:hypothetical protein
MVRAGFTEASSEDVEPFCGVASLYPISVGTLSEVMPSTHEPHDICRRLIASLRTIASGPCLDYVYVVWCAAVYSCYAYSTSASNSFVARQVYQDPPLYVVPKSTPTMSLSCAIVAEDGLAPVATLELAPGLNANGTLFPRIGNVPFMIRRSTCCTELVLM